MQKTNEIDIVLNQAITESNSKNFFPIISFSEPLFFVINYLDNVFLGYVLQNRTLVKNNERADIKEIFISKTDPQLILEMFNKTKSIYDVLNANQEKYRIGKIGDKIFKAKKIEDVEEISNRIPEKEYYLDLNLISDIRYKEAIIKNRNTRLKNYRSNNTLYNFQENNKDRQKFHNLNLNLNYEIIDNIAIMGKN